MKTIYSTFWLVFFFELGVIHAQEWLIFNESNSVLPTNYINDLDIDSNETYWICTDKGVCSFNSQINSWNLYTKDNCDMITSSVNCAAIEGDSIWFGTGGELMLYNIKTEKWSYYDIRNILGINDWNGGDKIIDITISKSGKKYLGTNEGLIVFDNTNFTRYYAGNSGLLFDFIYHRVIMDPIYDTVAWFGLYDGGSDGGLVKFDGTNFTFYCPAPSGFVYPDWWNHVNDISFDSNGNIWTAGMMGVSCLDRNTMKSIDNYTSSNGLQDGYLWAVEFEGPIIWIGSDLIGSLYQCENGWCNYFNSTNSGMPAWESSDDTRVSDIVIDKNGNKWMTTFSGVVAYKNGGVVLNELNESDLYENSFTIFPNPSNGKEIHIQLNDLFKDNVKIEIYSMDGKFLHEQAINSNELVTLSLDLAEGVYNLILKNNESFIINRLLSVY